jgi:hypothetical protein
MPELHEVTALIKREMLTVPNERGPQRRTVRLMNIFIRSFVECYGNVTAACNRAQISRQSYYRWIEGKESVHRMFQKKIASRRIEELIVDLAEATVVKHMVRDDKDALVAAIFTLKTKGRGRGWDERREASNAALGTEPAPPLQLNAAPADIIRDTVTRRANEKGSLYVHELRRYLNAFGTKIPEAIKNQLEEEWTKLTE